MLELEHHVDLVAVRVGESRASSTVTPGVSPTVRRRRAVGEHLACISCRNSWMRGPSGSRGCRRRAGPVDAARPSGKRGVLGEHVDDIHAEPVDPAVEPPAHHRVDGAPDAGVLPVEVGLLAREDVQVVLAAGVRSNCQAGPRESRPSCWARRRGRRRSCPAGAAATSTSRASGRCGLERDATNHGCSSEVWLTTRSMTSFMPRSWIAARRASKSASVPNTGSMSW